MRSVCPQYSRQLTQRVVAHLRALPVQTYLVEDVVRGRLSLPELPPAVQDYVLPRHHAFTVVGDSLCFDPETPLCQLDPVRFVDVRSATKLARLVVAEWIERVARPRWVIARLEAIGGLARFDASRWEIEVDLEDDQGELTAVFDADGRSFAIGALAGCRLPPTPAGRARRTIDLTQLDAVLMSAISDLAAPLRTDVRGSGASQPAAPNVRIVPVAPEVYISAARHTAPPVPSLMASPEARARLENVNLSAPPVPSLVPFPPRSSAPARRDGERAGSPRRVRHERSPWTAAWDDETQLQLPNPLAKTG